MKSNKLTLIEGKFPPEEAEQIVMEILSAEQRFYRLKSFSAQVRYGQRDESAEKQITEIEKQMDEFRKLLVAFKTTRSTLKIRSHLEISAISTKS